MESIAIGCGIVVFTWAATRWHDARLGTEQRQLLIPGRGSAALGVGALALIAY